MPLAKQRPTTTVNWAGRIAEVAARKDREAFRTLFEFFAPRIKAVLVRKGSDAAEAEEIAQEAMIAVWRKADQFDPATTGAAAWILAMVALKLAASIGKSSTPTTSPPCSAASRRIHLAESWPKL